jgi:hypothetical protein
MNMMVVNAFTEHQKEIPLLSILILLIYFCKQYLSLELFFLQMFWYAINFYNIFIPFGGDAISNIFSKNI